MSLWLILVVVAQFLNAIVALVDKFIVTSPKVTLRPFTYAFYMSVLSAASILVFLFEWIPIPVDGLAIPSLDNVMRPTPLVLALALVAGFSFFTALLSLFTALKTSDASDVVPVVGGINTATTFVLGWWLLGTRLSPTFFLGLALLVMGTVLVSRFRFSWRTSLAVLHAGILFGVHYIAVKWLFTVTHFDNGFFWSRMAIAGVALSLLLVPEYFEKVFAHTKKARRTDGAWLLGNKLLAGLVSIILLKAVEHGDVALVQALGGLQYVFLLMISIFFGHKLAFDCGENCTLRDILQKLIAIPIIVLGFLLLFI